MLPIKVKSLINKYCMGVTPSDEQMDEIMNLAEILNADNAEVSAYMKEMIGGPTKEEREAAAKAKEEERKAAAKAKEEEREATAKAEKEEKRKANRREIASVLMKNWKITAVVIVVLLILLWRGVSALIPKPLEDNPKATVAAIKEAAANNDYEGVSNFYYAFTSKHSAKKIKDAESNFAESTIEVIKVAIANGDMEKAMSCYDSYAQDHKGRKYKSYRNNMHELLSKAIKDEINNAINLGNVDKAYDLYKKYLSEYYEDVWSTGIELAKACVRSGKYDKAETMIDDEARYRSNNATINNALLDEFIRYGQYDKAELCVSHGLDTYFEYLCKCIDHMKKNGGSKNVRSFIDRKVSYYHPDQQNEGWKQAEVKDRLYKYAGIK